MGLGFTSLQQNGIAKGNIANNGDTLYGNGADDEYRLLHNTLTVTNYRYVKIRHQTLR
jgi:hypothetical protein